MFEGPAGAFHDSTPHPGVARVDRHARRLGPAPFPRQRRARRRGRGRLGRAPRSPWVACDSTWCKRIDRCVMTTRPQPGGIERDLDVLRSIHRTRDGCLAIGALVATPGPRAGGRGRGRGATTRADVPRMPVPSRPNVLFMMTDEERYPPPYEAEALAEFRRTQLPARERLRARRAASCTATTRARRRVRRAAPRSSPGSTRRCTGSPTPTASPRRPPTRPCTSSTPTPCRRWATGSGPPVTAPTTGASGHRRRPRPLAGL